MVGAESAGQVLGAKELEVVGDREDFGFGVEVVGRGVLKGACSGWFGVWKYWRGRY